jgi:hypothetical protein
VKEDSTQFLLLLGPWSHSLLGLWDVGGRGVFNQIQTLSFKLTRLSF